MLTDLRDFGRQTGADALFVMNYPGYVGEIHDDPEYHVKNPGLGYKYTSDKVNSTEIQLCFSFLRRHGEQRARCRLEADVEPHEQVFAILTKQPDYYREFLNRYVDLSANEMMKHAMTDMAFAMTRRVWMDLPTEHRGKCFFCIGGINAINPFSATAVKNEIAVYVDEFVQDCGRIPPEEGAFYDMEGKRIGRLSLSNYDEIYMDFNGSMAFFNAQWKEWLTNPAILPKVPSCARVDALWGLAAPYKGTCITDPGRVRDGRRALRCPADDLAIDTQRPEPIQQVQACLRPMLPVHPAHCLVSDFRSATMNQLYHPEHTADFFDMLAASSIAVFTVTNNAVHDLTTYSDPEKKNRTLDGVKAFLVSNGFGPLFARFALR